MRGDNDLTECKLDFDIEGLTGESDKAWWVCYKGNDIWVPKSISKLNDDNTIVSIPEWFAKKNGFPV